jgi:hypothetical protein
MTKGGTVMTTPKPFTHEAIYVKDALRGALTLIGAQPQAVQLGYGLRNQPEITIKLSVMYAQYVADQLEPSRLHVTPIPGMLLWSDKQMCVGRVESVHGEMVILLTLANSARWRSEVAQLRPALQGEIEAAQRKAQQPS